MDYIIDIILDYKSVIDHYLNYTAIARQYSSLFYLFSDKYDDTIHYLIYHYDKSKLYFSIMPSNRRCISNFLIGSINTVKLPNRF